MSLHTCTPHPDCTPIRRHSVLPLSGGIHFTSANIEGQQLGKAVADYGIAEFLRSEGEDIYAPIVLLNTGTGPNTAPPVLSGLALDNRDGMEVIQASIGDRSEAC